MTEIMYSIKEAAKELGVETHALRFWEDELGLRIARNEQGRRIYSEENMQEFRRIMEWKKQGLQLKAIKQLIHSGEGNLAERAGQMPLSTEEVAARRIIVYRPKENGREEAQQFEPVSAEYRQLESAKAEYKQEETAKAKYIQLEHAQTEPKQLELTNPEHKQFNTISQERLEVTQRLEQYAEQAQHDLESMQKMDLERAEKARRLQELLKQFIAESIRESNTELLQGMKEGLMKELDYQFRLQEEREEEREKLRIEKEDEHFRQLDENLRSAMEKRGRKKKKGIFSKG